MSRVGVVEHLCVHIIRVAWRMGGAVVRTKDMRNFSTTS